MSNGQNLGGRSREEYLADEVRILRHQVEMLLMACKTAAGCLGELSEEDELSVYSKNLVKAEETLVMAISRIEGGAT